MEAETPKTVKCRIALAVDPRGEWNACGWGNGWSKASDVSKMLLAAEPLEPLAANYWVEVEVPVPTVPTICAEAKEAGDV